MSELVPVRVRDCPDGTHPEGDSVWIAPRLSLEGGMKAKMQQHEGALRSVAGDPEAATWLTLRLLDTWVRHGAVAWNLHDADDTEPWPFDVERLLADFDLGWPVAEAADDLYSEIVTGGPAPLAASRPPNSRRGRTAPSTPRKPATTSPRSSSRRASAGQRSAAIQ